MREQDEQPPAWIEMTMFALLTMNLAATVPVHEGRKKDLHGGPCAHHCPWHNSETLILPGSNNSYPLTGKKCTCRPSQNLGIHLSHQTTRYPAASPAPSPPACLWGSDQSLHLQPVQIVSSTLKDLKACPFERQRACQNILRV